MPAAAILRVEEDPMPNPDHTNAQKPFPIYPKSWEEQASPGLKEVKKSPRLERPGKIHLPDQPGQALDLTDPGIEEAIEAADPGLSHERLGHGHKSGGTKPGSGNNW
jgi:hypothetical protein